VIVLVAFSAAMTSPRMSNSRCPVVVPFFVAKRLPSDATAAVTVAAPATSQTSSPVPT
jgi:hypothetical protein